MTFLMTVVLVLHRIITFIFLPLVLLFSKSKSVSVPPLTDDLLKISAKKLSLLIRQKKVPCEDVVRAYIERIKQVNPFINAVVDERFDEALKEAKSVDSYLRTTSLTENELETIKPLLGVPVTIKESCMLSGMSYAVGAKSREGVKADSDGEAVSRLKMSGAIPLLVSNTPEFCAGWCCQNYITGSTKNPYDITRNSGGSSGGEAALLGAGASLIGIGSDLAGSIRFPAMCCGIFGHKTSPRLIPLKGHFPLPVDKESLDYLVIGPMTRYAEDLNLMLTVLCGRQSIDLKLNEKVDVSKLRVYCFVEVPPSVVNPLVQNEFKEAIRASLKFLIQVSGATIVQTHILYEGFRNSPEFSSSLLTQVETPTFFKDKSQTALMELLKALLGKSEYTVTMLSTMSVGELKNLIFEEKHVRMKEELRRTLLDELREDGVLLYPTFSSPALKPAEFFFKIPGVSYMTPFNVLGFPATNVPCGRTDDGLPIGIQVIAAPNQDRLCLAVAEELEKCFGGWTSP